MNSCLSFSDVSQLALAVSFLGLYHLAGFLRRTYEMVEELRNKATKLKDGCCKRNKKNLKQARLQGVV